MFNPLKFLFTESKSSRAARLVALESGGWARWTPRDYAALAREGYARNAIVYRAVRLIAESIGACASFFTKARLNATAIRCSIS